MKVGMDGEGAKGRSGDGFHPTPSRMRHDVGITTFFTHHETGGYHHFIRWWFGNGRWDETEIARVMQGIRSIATAGIGMGGIGIGNAAAAAAVGVCKVAHLLAGNAPLEIRRWCDARDERSVMRDGMHGITRNESCCGFGLGSCCF